MAAKQGGINWKDVRRALEAASRGHTQGSAVNWSDASKILAYVCVIGSAVFWIPIQLDLAMPIGSWREWAIGTMNGAFMVIGPPVFVAPFVPRSRIQQLLLEINALTIGRGVSLGVGLYLIVYAWMIMTAWWAGRPNVNETGLLQWQVMLGIIFTVLAPTLLIASASMREADEEVEREQRDQQLLQAYRRQQQLHRNRMTMLAMQHRNAVRLLKRGIAELGGKELQELTGYLSKLDEEEDRAFREAAALREHAGVLTGLQEITGSNPDLTDHLEYIAMIAEELSVPRSQRDAVPADVLHAPVTRRAIERAAAEQPAPSAPVDQELYTRARAALDSQPVWTRENLQGAIGCGRTKAGDLIREWRAAGLVFEHQNLANHYSFANE